MSDENSNEDYPYWAVAAEDIERAAHQMIKMHGKDAPKQAALRSNEAREAGDEFNYELWLRVAMAVVAVQFPQQDREIIYSTNLKVFTEAEVWAAAKLLLEYFPDCASLLAAQRADGALEEGDTDNFEGWRRISRAVEELERVKPRPDEPLN
jgi:hypothetical protein